MNDKVEKAEQDDFEAATRIEFIARLGSKEKKYFIQELTWDAAQDLAEKVQKEAESKGEGVSKIATPRWIAESVYREDGSRMTIDEARNLRAGLSQLLEREILRINGFAKEEAAAVKKE